MADIEADVSNKGVFADRTLVDLNDRLDLLWAKYLELLSSYTHAQKSIQEHLSAGFFSLARANFTSKTGRRYGRDFFHDGAIATLRIRIADVEGSGLRVEKTEWSEQSEDQTSDNLDKQLESSSTDTGSRSNEKVLASSDTVDTGNEGKSASTSTLKEDSDQNRPKKPSLATDPLRWYGILVPFELRQTQSHFSKLFDSPVVDAVTSARDMRQIDNEIRKLRKEIRKAQKNEHTA